jgi:two-component system response regulator NreC
MTIRVIVTDDHKVFREGLVTLLQTASGIEVIAEAEDGLEAIKMAKQFNPDLILLDIAMPNMNGIEATRELKKVMPELKIIAVSMHSDYMYIKEILEAGADGYLLKNSTYQQLTDAIHSVYSGKKALDDQIAEVVLNGFLGPPKTESKDYDQLSEREKEIFNLIAEGKTIKEIADQLFINVETVETHKKHILEELELKSDIDLVKYALKNGLIKLH